MRNFTLLGMLTAASFATATMGQSLTGEGGKFSASNIAPLLFCGAAALLFAAARGRLDRRLLWLLFAFNVSSLLSFLVFLVRFGWEPNLLVLAFQDVEILFCLLLYWYAKEHLDEFRRAMCAGIYLSFIPIAYFGYENLRDPIQWSFGMDDKSHTAVLFCCEAFILIRFVPSTFNYLVALSLVVLSMLTISREPFILLPAILLALSVRSRWGIALTAVLACGVGAAVWIAGDAILNVFTVFDRLSSVGRVTGEGSTVVHMLLIESALSVKFSDPWAFFFGIGPGNFSKALTTFQVLLPEIQAVDPVLASAAQNGAAPMHSVPTSLLVDTNILIFLVGVFLGLKAARYLWRTRNAVDIVFVGSFFLASMFYSLHNKPYFFLVLTTLTILIQAEWEGWPASRAAAAWTQRQPRSALR